MEEQNNEDHDVSLILAERAREIEEWAEEHFIDCNGVVYTAINRETEKPLDDSFFDDNSETHVSGVGPVEFWSYENCGMTTGAYLQSMVFRYRVEKDPVALKRARRCFLALKYIYDLGKEYEEGYFPKIYGNKFSMQTSSDQMLYCVMALDQFHPLADIEEQKEISRMISEQVRFWAKHDYKFIYYDRGEINWPLVRFPSVLLLAYNHSKDDFFKNEYHRLLDLGVADGPEFAWLDFKKSGKRNASQYEKKAGAWIINSTPDLFAMDVMQLDYKLRHDPENKHFQTWKNSIALMWEEAKIMLSPDGKTWVCVLVDMKTGELLRPEDRFAENDIPEAYQGLTKAKWGRSTITARSAVQASYFFPDNNEMTSTAKQILASREIKDLVDMEDVDPSRHRYYDRTRFLCGDTMSNWLWGYWQGKFQGFWK